jgi:tetraacyldisaccharide 4'-kinase
MRLICSQLFKMGVRLRHFLYDKKILAQKLAPLPVVSIGNLMAGGVGKTQVALMLAELLAKDLRVAILSRGYRSRAEHAKNPLLVDVKRHSPYLCGDEPWLLASRLESSLIVVNKNRFKSALEAQKQGAELLLLDDGMQHRKLHRDFEIVVLDGTLPLGHFLPKGLLRENPERLKVAHLILFVGSPTKELEKEITTWTHAPHVAVKIVCTGIFQLDGKPIDTLKDKKVALFCGIGNPQRFVNSVEELGAHVVASHFLPDHHVMGKKQLQKFAFFAKAKGATHLLCTEKDKVKLSMHPLPLPIAWIRASLQIVKNHSLWLETVNEIKSLVSRQL